MSSIRDRIELFKRGDVSVLHDTELFPFLQRLGYRNIFLTHPDLVIVSERGERSEQSERSERGEQDEYINRISFSSFRFIQIIYRDSADVEKQLSRIAGGTPLLVIGPPLPQEVASRFQLLDPEPNLEIAEIIVDGKGYTLHDEELGGEEEPEEEPARKPEEIPIKGEPGEEYGEEGEYEEEEYGEEEEGEEEYGEEEESSLPSPPVKGKWIPKKR
jgi:hypothetical protein